MTTPFEESLGLEAQLFNPFDDERVISYLARIADGKILAIVAEDELSVDDSGSRHFGINGLELVVRRSIFETAGDEYVEPDPDKKETVLGGRLVVDPTMGLVVADRRPVDLTYQEFRLLTFFVKHPNEIFSREDLLDGAWDKGFHEESEKTTVTEHVRRLRVKPGLEDITNRHIVTKRKQGYMWFEPLDKK